MMMPKVVHSSPKIIILSDVNDAHIPFVTKYLTVPYVVVDPNQMAKGVEISYQIGRNGKLKVIYGGATLDNVISVWCRKFQDLTLGPVPVSEEYREYAYSALQGHMDILRGIFPDALWVSDFYAIRRASNKPRQLEIAHHLGFNTPDTLMTSSDEAAIKFIDAHASVLVKTLANVFVPKPDGTPTAFFARKITNNELSSVSGLRVAPAIFQEVIDAEIDIRVTVIGSKVLAASITGSAVDKEGSPVRDWRIAHCEGDVEICAFELPDDIARMCVNHVKEMNLHFGAIDLVIDKKGTYWFLENNPNGQWAFVEEYTGQPMGKELARLLSKGRPRQKHPRPTVALV